jgi:uncharacterized protein YkwD
MVMNPVMTLANDNEAYLIPKWVFPGRKSRNYRTGCEKVRENQSFGFKGQIIAGDEALKMIALVNQERMDAGLTKLEVDSTLMKLAEEKCWDMVRFNYFGHNSKQLGTIYNQLDRAQFQYQSAAENLIGAPNPRRAFQKVLLSPAHRGNIMNPHFRKIGIAIIKGGPYGEMIVQILVDSLN